MVNISLREILVLVVAVASTTVWCMNLLSLQSKRQRVEMLAAEKYRYEQLYNELREALEGEGFTATEVAGRLHGVVHARIVIIDQRDKDGRRVYPVAPDGA